MTIKHFKKRLIGDAQAKTKATHSAIVKKTKCPMPSKISSKMAEDKMSDDEFNKAMAALNNIWSVCPTGIPKDLSTKHDYYLFEEKK